MTTAAVGRIRRAAPGEAARLSELAYRAKAMWGYDAAFMAACRDELTLTPRQIANQPTYVYEEVGQAVGFYRLADDGGEVELFFVAPEAARRGIGRALWQHMRAEAHRRGTRRVVVASDPYAVGFYERMGARHDGNAPSASIPGRLLPRLTVALVAEAK